MSCRGQKKNGQACLRQAKTTSDYCWQHHDECCDPNVKSWIVLAIRTIMGEPDVRKFVLNYALESYKDQFHIGEQFSVIWSESRTQKQRNIYWNKIDQFMTHIIMQNKGIFLFSAANLPDAGGETHYQTYIADAFNRKLYMIDPSMKPVGKNLTSPFKHFKDEEEWNQSRMSIYIPLASNEIGQYFQQKGQYNVYWIHTSRLCQRDSSDVFCQSWSLYLQIQALIKLFNHDISPIEIPCLLENQYQVLFDFYQKIFNYPFTRTKLIEEYKHMQYDGFIDEYRRIDINKCVMALSYTDLMDE